MTSKTFKSVTPGNNHVLYAHPSADQVRVAIEGKHHSGIIISRDDAPALALAILEAAGLTVAKDDFKEGSVEDLLIDAALHLKGAIRLQERATAEAEAQAKLEAEALELFRASQCIRTDGMYASVPSFAQLSDPSKTKWLAVARRAREINKEEKNA